MLTLYRRHNKECGRADRYYKRCACAMWVEGTLDRQYMRKSLHTQSWERAKAIIDEWTNKGQPKPKPVVPTIAAAVTAYLAEIKERELSLQSQRNQQYILGRFVEWCQGANYQTIDEVNVACLREFFAAGEHAASTKMTARNILKQMLLMCIREKWISEDPTKLLPRLKVRSTPTDYLNRDEFNRLLLQMPDAKNLALTLLLRWSGLRITDALLLERHRIDSQGLLMLYQSKTDTPVSVLLPPHVIEVLPREGKRFFTPNNASVTVNALISRANRYRIDLAAAAERAKIKHTHPHMLRDTFAIELLLAGVPLDQVSKLLGHASIKTTEKHYAPWVKARQEQLNAAVRLAWV